MSESLSQTDVCVVKIGISRRGIVETLIDIGPLIEKYHYKSTISGGGVRREAL